MSTDRARGTPESPPVTVAMLQPLRVLPGTAMAQRQPVAIAVAAVRCPDDVDLAEMAATLTELAGAPLGAPARTGGVGLAAMILAYAVALQRAAGHPILDAGAVTETGPDRFMIAIPYDDAACVRRAVRGAVDGVRRLAAAGPRASHWATLLPALAEETESLLDGLRLLGPRTPNSVHLLHAARELGVPWMRLALHVYQIGHGRHARRFDSTLTDATPKIGSTCAQNKVAAAQMLRRAGLPAPLHVPAPTEALAVAIAQRLGYPVVVKPVDLDGGVGVAAGLRDEASLRSMFRRAAEHGRPLLVEKHQDGEDFRLFVVGGRVTWAIERKAGGVTGDGAASVATLLHRLNADPRRGTSKRSPLKTIAWDEEARSLVAEQGLSADAVPEAGRFVPLRRVANVASGGMPIAALERVHPDNLQMAVRAARVLDLDIAGVDFITPDIGRPWHQVGGVINEVNAQPSLGVITARHVFGEIVQWMLGGGDGRLPIAAITGTDDAGRVAVARRVHQMLTAQGTCAGLGTAEGAWMATERIGWGGMAGFAGGRLLLAERDAAAVVLELAPDGLGAMGSPFDRCDVVTVVGTMEAAGPPVEDLVRRARHAVVVPLESADEWRRHVDPRKLIVVASGASDRRLHAHLNAGSGLLWQEVTPRGAMLHMVPGRGRDGIRQGVRLALKRPVGSVRLHAAATAHAMQCESSAIGRIIALEGRAGGSGKADGG